MILDYNVVWLVVVLWWLVICLILVDDSGFIVEFDGYGGFVVSGVWFECWID